MTGHVKNADRLLPAFARAAIAHRLGASSRLPRTDLDARLERLAASFVTLTQGAALRGCIGSLEASRPLVDDVETNAVAAAFEDRRFAPLEISELGLTRVEVSVLSPVEPLEASGEADLLARLRPGEDGLVLVCGEHRATFLPQVWEQLPEPRGFVDQLRRKAGLPADFWGAGPRFCRYRVRKWTEEPSL